MTTATEELGDAAKRLAQALGEALAHQRSEDTGASVVHYAVDVRRIREQLGLTRDEFSRRYGFNTRTVEGWEQGRRTPTGPARTLLTVLAHEPEAVERALQEAA